jgi:Transglutaminase-like superfamily
MREAMTSIFSVPFQARVPITTLVFFTLFRCLFFGIVLFFVNKGFTLGTSFPVVLFTGLGGIVIGSTLASLPLRSRGVLTILLISGGLGLLILAGISRIPVPGSPESLWFFALASHLRLLLMVALSLCLSTWAVIKTPQAATIELLLFVGFAVYLLSGHREFHLDKPQVINSLAWAVHVSPQALLTLLGSFFAIIMMGYLVLAHLVSYPPIDISVVDKAPLTGGQRVSRILLVVAGILSLIFVISFTFYERYQALSASLLTNGVGQAEGEGTSPLGFHSSLGATNQPAAVVRLESDYTTNPFSPMLYLRESALSELGTREMHMASTRFDRDISRTTPLQHYYAEQIAVFQEAQNVTISVYLIGEHKNPFTIGVPLSIIPIKNPEPARFKQSYKAVSLAPAFNLKNIVGYAVGDSLWSKEEWEHYLKPHPDPRYWEYARRITGQISTTRPLELAFAISQYLSKASIYTLSPNHQVAANQDPVAPYLFGDMRGYCVHFAHATVYMLRALGIPARIGTGYLTDFSQAKDGHILLRMSDRHAWAEVYVRDIGWVPYDTKPENVESHADTQVDKNLLEELMGLLEPSEEILPKVDEKKEPRLERQREWELPDGKTIFSLLLLSILVLLSWKVYLRFGYLLPSSPRSRLRRLYVHCASFLVDSGLPRRSGETRNEYLRRAKTLLAQDTDVFISKLLIAEFGSQATLSDMTLSLRGLVAPSFPWWRRLIGFLNPSSLFYALQRRF